MFGVLWGIATVIILVSVVNGFRHENEKWLEDMGVNLLVLEYSSFYLKEGVKYPLSYDEEDARFLEANSPLVEEASPQMEEWREMQVGTEKDWFGLTATTSDMRELRDYQLETGRFLSPVDEKNASKVAVIGSRVKETFFGEDTGASAVVGESIVISGVTFEIVGVLAERSGRTDWSVTIPITTYQTSLAKLGQGARWGNMTIYAKLVDQREYEGAVTQVRRMLASKHGFDPADEMAVRVRDFSERRAETNVLLMIMFLITYTIGIVTLAIGAVGVMNIMLVNVRERVREIGLRKAIGASRLAITSQFLVEALTLMVMGGLAGIALGVLVVGVLRALPLPEGFPSPILTLPTIYTALIVNILVGVTAGTYPALVASAFDPIVALRTE